VGADADITVYARDADIAKMFSSPRFVLKGGQLVVEEGHLRRAPQGRRLHVRPPFDESILRDVRKHFDNYATVAFDNYAVRDVPGAPAALQS
jgi:formylmethanofuran dehydrogenase subunit A